MPGGAYLPALRGGSPENHHDEFDAVGHLAEPVVLKAGGDLTGRHRAQVQPFAREAAVGQDALHGVPATRISNGLGIGEEFMSTASHSTTAYRIDPDLYRVARLYRRVDHADPEAVRREAARRIKVSQFAGLWVAADPAVHVEDRVVHDGTGHEVAVRIYRSKAESGPRPAVVYLHGGAFISGDLDFEHPRCLETCRETGCTVVAVDYRLAPEHPYPAGLDDCVAAYRWLCAKGASIGVETARIAIAGASAGGALTAALCMRARDGGLPAPALQMLLYPVTDDRLRTASMRAFTDTPAWDAPNCVHMWNHYLGPVERRGNVSPYAAPGRATDLSGLPDAYVMTAELDPLRDEGAHYARALADAGASTELHCLAGAFHAFDTLSSAPLSLRARREHHEVLRTRLGQNPIRARRSESDRHQPPPEEDVHVV
jgi:acetyl esterase